MENIIKGIMDAAAEALKKGIKANAVFINDRLFFSKLTPFSAEVPIVCGLKAYYTVELPDDVLFAVAHREERERVAGSGHGEWVHCVGKSNLWYCSECGEKINYTPKRRTYNIRKRAVNEVHKYCRYCGARMDGEGESNG